MTTGVMSILGLVAHEVTGPFKRFGFDLNHLMQSQIKDLNALNNK